MRYLFNKFYLFLEDLPAVGSLFRNLRYPLMRVIFNLQSKSRREWEQRIQDVLSCPDNQFIPRVYNAGETVDGFQIMHNGLKIKLGSYNGEGLRLLLQQNDGVHEPQEERIFMEVLKHLPSKATMIELGAYWSFYSMWFHSSISNPTCFLIEPSLSHLRYGQENFSINGMQGIFTHAFVGKNSDESTENGVPMICIDDFLQQKNISHVHLLHADIQGSELDMLYGAEKALEQGRIDYLFISTHSNKLHSECINFVESKDYSIFAEHNLNESYSMDGLFVAVSSGISAPNLFSISKKGLPSLSL